jgi:hypothetical protein
MLLRTIWFLGDSVIDGYFQETDILKLVQY